MKVKELIEKLKEFDENLDVFTNCRYIEHDCGGDNYCYCSTTDHIGSDIYPVFVESMSYYDFNYKKNKKSNKPSAVVINVESY